MFLSGKQFMSEDFYSLLLVLITLFIIFIIVFVVPQAIGLGFYRLLKPRSVYFALVAGFLAPLILYGAVFSYFWYGTAPTPASELPSGEGDMVGPAISGLGFILNAGGGAALYLYLFAKNKQLSQSSLK